MYTVKDILPSGKISDGETVLYDEAKLKTVFELDKCIAWVKQKNFKRVCIQFSTDQLPKAPLLVFMLERELDQKLYVLGDTSYSSCCVDEVSAQHVSADCIIHLGHTCLSTSERLPVLHIFNREQINIETFSNIFLNTFSSEDNIILLYDVSYHHAINNIKQSLTGHISQLIVAQLSIEGMLSSTHSFFGRSFSIPCNKKLNDYTVVFIGKDGPCIANFKLLFPELPFYLYNPLSPSKIVNFQVNTSKFLKKRMFLIESLRSARNIGILIGTVCVKNYLQAVERIKCLTKPCGIKCYIISVGKINVPKLANFPEIDAFVIISCAENSLLDSKEFLRPIVTPYEVELAFNSAYKWSEKYVTDFTTLLPGCVNHIAEKFDSQESSTNVSLITGNVQNTSIENIVAGSSTSLVTKGLDTLALSESHGINYFNTRSWVGLEQKLGQTVVEKAALGRSGLPFKYENESV